MCVYTRNTIKNLITITKKNIVTLIIDMKNYNNKKIPTFKKSRSHTTSGFGSPITSHAILTVSPSYASLDRGFVTNIGSFEYL